MIAIKSLFKSVTIPTISRSASIDGSPFQLKPRHKCKDATACEMVTLEQQKNDSIVGGLQAEEETPFLTYSQAEGPDKHILKTRYKHPMDGFPSVAISHVRSDGLGNSEANALPACVLKWLQAMVDEMYDVSKHPIPFWIDTICLPVERPARKSILRNMRHTFSECDRVLVLDSSLYDTPATLLAEQFLLIKKSLWLTRLWTLQEGLVAKELYFRFQGHFSELEALIVDHYTQEGSIRSALDLVLLSYSEIRSFEDIIGSIPDTTSKDEKYRLRMVLRLGYLSLPRFQCFATAIEMEMIPKAIDEIRQVQRLGPCQSFWSGYSVGRNPI